MQASNATKAAPAPQGPAPKAPANPAPAAPKAVPAPAAVAYVSLLVPGNPKRPGSASAARFALYQHGATVAAYRAAVVAAGQPNRLASADLLWDVRHGFIALTPAAPTGPAPSAPKA